MRMRKTAVAFGIVVLLVSVVPLLGQEAAGSHKSYDEILEGFFGQLEEGDYGKALDGLYATNEWLAANRDQVTQLKNQFVGLSALLGNYIDHERLIVQPLGDRFVYVWELAYFDREPLQFHFTFYKAKGSWQLFTISYDEDADVSAKELAKRRLASEP